jgi:hypothetical protein
MAPLYPSLSRNPTGCTSPEMHDGRQVLPAPIESWDETNGGISGLPCNSSRTTTLEVSMSMSHVNVNIDLLPDPPTSEKGRTVDSFHSFPFLCPLSAAFLTFFYARNVASMAPSSALIHRYSSRLNFSQPEPASDSWFSPQFVRQPLAFIT